jgi:integrase/recombinase XerC/integrase/recombinase XerD
MAEDFLQQHDVSLISRRQYLSNLKQLINWLRDNNRSERHITKIDIIDFKRDMQKQGRTAATVANYLTTFKVFFRYLQDLGLMSDIMYGIKYPKKDKTYKKLPFSDDEVYKLMQTVMQTKNKIIRLRDYAMINLMLLTGMRTIEVSRIRVKDIKTLPGKTIIKLRGKGDFDYNSAVNVDDDLMIIINDYLVEREDFNEDDFLFVSFSNRNRNGQLVSRTISTIVSDYLKTADIKSEYHTAHSLRHTAAMKFLEHNGENYEALRIYMRHASPATTQVYTHMYTDKIKQSANQYSIANAYPHLR